MACLDNQDFGRGHYQLKNQSSSKLGCGSILAPMSKLEANNQASHSP